MRSPGPFSLLLLQNFDGVGSSPLDCSAIAANDGPSIQMGASTSIKYPPAPSDTTGARILPYLYTVFLWFFHSSGIEPPPSIGQHPVDAGAFGISSFLPGGGFGDEPGVAVDASIETLAGQDADLDLDHVEPTCVALGRNAVELQAAQNASRFIGRECLVERAGRMR